MREARTVEAAQHPPKAKLASRRRGEVFSANDVSDSLRHVIDRDRELIRPVSIAIAQQQIAALPRGRLLDGAKEQIVNPFHACIHPDAKTPSRTIVEPTLATVAVVSLAGDVLSRALACVDVMRAPKPVERLAVHAVAIALTHQRVKATIRLEAKPLQVFENAGFVLRPAANPIVILHAQQHAR